jgi:hypothetical protein
MEEVFFKARTFELTFAGEPVCVDVSDIDFIDKIKIKGFRPACRYRAYISAEGIIGVKYPDRSDLIWTRQSPIRCVIRAEPKILEISKQCECSGDFCEIIVTIYSQYQQN